MKIYEDENIIWTPAGNPTLQSKDKADELFPAEEVFRTISLILEAPEGKSVITIETLKELEIFEEVLYSIWEYEDTTMDETNNIVRPGSGTKYYWKDICVMETYKRSSGTLERCRGFNMQEFSYSKDTDFTDGSGSYG